MKMLILMPLDEKMVYAATGIYKELPDEVKDITFNMPMMMEYLIVTKQAENYENAAVDVLYSACKVYEAAENNNLVVIGNMPKNFKFDYVYNFQDIEQALPYKDLFIENLLKKCKEVLEEDNIVFKYLDNLHTADESLLSLENCEATAHFIGKFVNAGKEQ